MLDSTGAWRISICSASSTPIRSPTSTAQASRTAVSCDVNHLPTAGTTMGAKSSSRTSTPAAMAKGSQIRFFFFGFVFMGAFLFLKSFSCKDGP